MVHDQLTIAWIQYRLSLFVVCRESYCDIEAITVVKDVVLGQLTVEHHRQDVDIFLVDQNIEF